MNLFKLLEMTRSPKKNADPMAHMTWASKSISRTMTRTGVFLKKQIWIWPIIATVLLSMLAFGVRRAIETTMKENLRSQLSTLLSVEVAMLDNWFRTQMSNVTSTANSLPVRESIYEMLASEEITPATATKRVPELQQQLRKQLGPVMTAHDYVGYFVINKSKQIIAASQDELIGRRELAEHDSFITRALQGEVSTCPPFPSVIPMKDETGHVRTGVPTMYVCAPVRDASFEVVGVLAFRIRPELEMTRILQLGRIGESGETYAFDKSGLLVSNSRFDDQLILLGVLPDETDAKSILKIQLRDPQGNLQEGFRPHKRRSELPLTRMVSAAIDGPPGVDVEGYRDYRGIPVVGAWQWLPQYGMGVTTEMDVAEAFRPLIILQWTFWALYILLGISAVAIFIFTIIVARLRREAQKASIEARQLGQYKLESKLGAGAMGVVYLGHHAMLRRPTAIKLLDLDKVNDASIQRFEREVQITCQLNHPNTVAIYDYGRTPEGVFYYAMEFLDGVNLQTLIEQYGPQSEGRVIRILLQLCGSLFEAHSLGLVHRDIKPSNLMLNRRGCESDVLKVLDFGLVKAIDEEKQANLTSANSLTGTPLYMAPEAIQSPNSVDSRSDLYAVGAVGYFLLTGQPVFAAAGLMELCQQHIDAIPIPPSTRLGKPVSPELESALLGCLEKSRSKRPATARDLAQLLLRCPTANDWTLEDSDAWWGRHERGVANPTQPFGNSTVAGSLLTQVPPAFERTMISNDGE
jgi:serine/threonine protein kinase